MTLENVKKQYIYFCKLAKGEFNERSFDIESGVVEKDERNRESESGITLQGKMTPQRVELIKGNALRHKLDIEKKFPQLIETPSKPDEAVQEAANLDGGHSKTKSKEKK